MVWAGIMGQGGGWEGCMMRIREGAGRIGQGGDRNLVVGLVEGCLLLSCWLWFRFHSGSLIGQGGGRDLVIRYG
jgi:hypothetical protein